MEKILNTTGKTFESYEEYNHQGGQYIVAQREFYSSLPDTGRKFFQSTLENNIQEKTVADIGCGAGDDLVLYANMGAGKVFGVEPSSLMYDAANTTLKEKGIQAELFRGQWDSIPLSDSSVDVVTSRYSFHLIPDFEKAFQEVARILKPGGHFLIAVPHPKYDKKLVEEQRVGPGQRIKSALFGGKVIVENYPHTIENYIGGTALQYFTVEKIMEYSMNEQEGEIEPTALLINYRKK